MFVFSVTTILASFARISDRLLGTTLDKTA